MSRKVQFMDILQANDIISQFRKFQKKSRKKYKALLERIKEDKKYLSGEQYSKDDIDILGKERSENKLNIVRNAIRTISNAYREATYKWRIIDNQTNQVSNTLTQFGINFITNPDNETAVIETLESTVAFGLGVLVISTDLSIDGTPEPTMYNVKELSNVYLDPDIAKTNGADATSAAIVEIKSRKWVENEYGIDVSTIENPLVDIDEEYDKKEYMPLVTFWTKENKQVICHKMIGNKVIESVILPMTYIPVIPVFGERSYINDELSWAGIIAQMKGIQKLINYAYSNILVRLATSPKNTWICESESIEGNEKYFRDSNKTLNPLLIWNKFSSDRKRELEKPERISNEIQLGDVGEMFSQSLQMVNAVIGIPAIGLESETEKTATEVLTSNKVFQNNIRSYMYNLKSSLKVAGLCLMELVSSQPLYGAVKVIVEAGPDEAMKRQEARVILQSMTPLITEPADQRKLLMAMSNIEQDNEYVQTLARMLQPLPTQQELEDQAMIAQANDEIKNRDNIIIDLNKQLEQAKRDSELKAYSLDREVTLAQLKHQQTLEQMILQHKLDGSLSEKDLLEMSMETEKNQMELEKEAMKLNGEKAKSEAEQIKAQNDVLVSNAKAEENLAKAAYKGVR